jgi:hypothetical protein
MREQLVRQFFSPQTDPESLKRSVRRWLMGAFWCAILVPVAFYLRFGEIPPLGWGTTVFFIAYCLLSAVGLHFFRRTEYHTPVEWRDDWLDRIGAFWLMACAFGPLFGWFLAAAFTLTTSNWRWLYGGRLALSIGLPLLTGMPLLRYVRGRGAPVMLTLLLSVTALPVWSAVATLRDYVSGPVNSVLPYTGRVVSP